MFGFLVLPLERALSFKYTFEVISLKSSFANLNQIFYWGHSLHLFGGTSLEAYVTLMKEKDREVGKQLCMNDRMRTLNAHPIIHT